MQFFETLFYFVVTLGALVFVHELGHFLAAKLCGMRVERFSIGFPPRAFGKQIGDTDYCISWFPVGGYVKIAGMIDESFDTEYLNRPPEPWEFRARPMWQRMLVISAGVIMNILLAIAIFWGINYAQGRTVRETTEVGFVAAGSAAEQTGIRSGDRFVRINGKAVTNWDDILNAMYLETLGSDLDVTMLRGGSEIPVRIPRSLIPDPSESTFGIVPINTEIVVNLVEPGKPADRLGLKPMDVLVSLGGEAVRLDARVREVVQSHAGKPMKVEWLRDGQRLSGETIPTDDGKIGIGYGAHYTGPVSTVKYGFFEAFPVGLKYMLNMSDLFLRQMWQLFTGKVSVSQSVGGPIRIAQMATQTAEIGLVAYLGFMALLSISLAFLNILPFPALDGGHLVFLVYEGVFRREIPVKIKMGIQKVGFALLLAFMAFVLYNDILNF
jgi:regulator of sigma E protease